MLGGAAATVLVGGMFPREKFGHVFPLDPAGVYPLHSARVHYCWPTITRIIIEKKRIIPNLSPSIISPLLTHSPSSPKTSFTPTKYLIFGNFNWS